MKIMVVSGQHALRASISQVLEVLMTDVQIIPSDHKDALIKFLDEDPTAVIICEYDERDLGGDGWEGQATFKDISGPADEGVKMIRLGFSDYPYDDYIKMPFDLPELIQKLRPD